MIYPIVDPDPDPSYGEYDDEEMRGSYLLGCVILAAGSVVLWTIVISLLRLLFEL